MSLSSSLANVDTMVSIGRAVAKIPLGQFVLVQYPTTLYGDGLVANDASAKVLIDAVKADKTLRLAKKQTGATSGTGFGGRRAPVEPDAAPSSHARARAPPTSSSDTVDLPSTVVGQTVEQQTCSVGNDLGHPVIPAQPARGIGEAGAMRVVIAPDSFKGTIDAAGRRRRARRGLALGPTGGRARRGADGRRWRGHARRARRSDPGVGARPGPRAGARTTAPSTPPSSACPTAPRVVELAATSGITLLDPPAPARGPHPRVRRRDPRRARVPARPALLLTIGGSASTDGGAGALRALGARFLDAAGREVEDGAVGLLRLDCRRPVRPRPGTRRAACGC